MSFRETVAEPTASTHQTLTVLPGVLCSSWKYIIEATQSDVRCYHPVLQDYVTLAKRPPIHHFWKCSSIRLSTQDNTWKKWPYCHGRRHARQLVLRTYHINILDLSELYDKINVSTYWYQFLQCLCKKTQNK